MKKNLLNFILLSSLMSLIALSNCANNKGDPNADKDNTGNHANTPPEASDAEYPGNRSDSTGSHTMHGDSIHNH